MLPVGLTSSSSRSPSQFINLMLTIDVFAAQIHALGFQITIAMSVRHALTVQYL